MIIDRRPPAAAAQHCPGDLSAASDVSAASHSRSVLSVAFDVLTGTAAFALLLVFAVAPPARPLAADPYLMSSPQSIGGRS